MILKKARENRSFSKSKEQHLVLSMVSPYLNYSIHWGFYKLMELYSPLLCVLGLNWKIS